MVYIQNVDGNTSSRYTVAKHAFYTLIQIQIQIFYLLITVPIAEQNNQTMNKHRYLYDWVDWLQI
jgi:hypothetical protein